MAYTTEESKIIKALQEHLKTHITDFATTVHFVGVAFKPPTTGKWFVERFFQNRPRSLGLEDSAQQEHRGIYQVEIVWKVGSGLQAQMDVAGEIVAHFAKGTSLTVDGVTVRVEQKPWPLTPINEGDEVRVPVTIPWRSIV